MAESLAHATQHLPQTADALAAQIAQRCDQARLSGTSWHACCPAHDDTTPSLSITPNADKVLLHCHAGCTVEAIVTALELTLADLFLAPVTPSPARQRRHLVKTYDYLG